MAAAWAVLRQVRRSRAGASVDKPCGDGAEGAGDHERTMSCVAVRAEEDGVERGTDVAGRGADQTGREEYEGEEEETCPALHLARPQSCPPPRSAGSVDGSWRASASAKRRATAGTRDREDDAEDGTTRLGRGTKRTTPLSGSAPLSGAEESAPMSGAEPYVEPPSEEEKEETATSPSKLARTPSKVS